MRLRTSSTRLFLLSSLAFVIASFAVAPQASAKNPAPGTEISVLAFGDSLTAGYTLPVSQGYPAQLERILRARGSHVKVTNAGVSGDTSAQGLRRVDWSLRQKRYDWVLLCLGANDGLRLLPLKDLEINLNSIVQKFTKAGVKVMLLGMKLPLNTEAKYREGFEKIFPRVAAQHKVPFYPFILDGVATSEMLNLDDQIHPNAQGYAIVAERVAQKLLPELGK